MEKYVRKYPEQVDNDNNQGCSFNDKSPPIELVIAQAWKHERKMQHCEQDSPSIIKQRVKPSEPRFIGPNHGSPTEIQHKNEGCQCELPYSRGDEEKSDHKEPSHSTELPEVEVLKIPLVWILIKKYFSKEVILLSFLLSHIVIVKSPFRMNERVCYQPSKNKCSNKCRDNA